METQLAHGLTFLSYATGIIVLLVGVMLCKVLFDLSKLTRNIDETTTIVRTELEPTLKNVNKSVEIVSGLITKTDESVQKVKAFLSKTPFKILGKLSVLTGKAAKGFFAGLFSSSFYQQEYATVFCN